MKHSIIKDFRGWQKIFEEAPVDPNFVGPTGPAAAPPAGGIAPPGYGGYAPPGYAGANTNAQPAASPNAGTSATGPSSAVKMPTEQIKSTDGAITRKEAIAIQQVLMAGSYLDPTFVSAKTNKPKPSDDGLIGKRSIAAILKFRDKHGIKADTAAPVSSRTGLTIGPATLAKFNEVIADPNKLIQAGELAETPKTDAQKAAEIAAAKQAADDAQKAQAAKEAAEKAEAERKIQAGNDSVVIIMDLISSQFSKSKDFFKDYETGFLRGDRVEDAANYFEQWFNKTIAPIVDSLPQENPNKAAFGPAGKTLLDTIKAGIINKKNNVALPYTDKAGKPAQIAINADF